MSHIVLCRFANKLQKRKKKEKKGIFLFTYAYSVNKFLNYEFGFQKSLQSWNKLNFQKLSVLKAFLGCVSFIYFWMLNKNWRKHSQWFWICLNIYFLIKVQSIFQTLGTADLQIVCSVLRLVTRMCLLMHHSYDLLTRSALLFPLYQQV